MCREAQDFSPTYDDECISSVIVFFFSSVATDCKREFQHDVEEGKRVSLEVKKRTTLSHKKKVVK